MMTLVDMSAISSSSTNISSLFRFPPAAPSVLLPFDFRPDASLLFAPENWVLGHEVEGRLRNRSTLLKLQASRLVGHGFSGFSANGLKDLFSEDQLPFLGV